MGKVITLKNIRKYLKPHSFALVGGFFDLFHVGHLRYLKKCAELKRPLVVFLLSDRFTKLMKGKKRPIIEDKQRAEIVASLGFVDYVIICDDIPYYDGTLKKIKPGCIIFSRENMKERLLRKKIIESEFPDTKVFFINKQSSSISTSEIEKKILNLKQDYSNIKDPIKKKLYQAQEESDAEAGKVGALLLYKNRIVETSFNTKNIHAEENLIKKARAKKIPFHLTKLFVTIPPCQSCAKLILKHKIPEVYFLENWGAKEGEKILKDNGIKINKYK